MNIEGKKLKSQFPPSFPPFIQPSEMADDDDREKRRDRAASTRSMDVTTPSESLRRWEALFAIPNSARIRRRHRPPSDSSSKAGAAASAACASVSAEDDPFDCSDVAVPPLPDQVERHVRQSIARWRNLDARRVIPEPSSSSSILTPFMTDLDIINAWSLKMDALLLPGIFAGILVGRRVIDRIPQKAFEVLLYAFSGIAGVRLFMF